MGKASFTEEFKRDAVRQITELGYPVAEVSQWLGVSQHSRYEWKKKLGIVFDLTNRVDPVANTSPDWLAAIVRNGSEGCELVTATCGMPTP